MNREILIWGNKAKEHLNSFNWEEIAFDTETSDLKQDRLEITGMSLCNETENYYVPVFPRFRKTIMEYFKDKFSLVKKLIAHNIVFDLRVISKYNIKINPAKTKIFDTMIAHHLIDENSKHGLKHLTRTILNREVEDYDENLSHYCEEFYQYALDDSYNTWLLYEEFLPQLKEQQLEHLFFKIEMPFQFVLLEMALEGVSIDRDLLEKQQDILQDEIFSLHKKLHEQLGLRHSVQMTFENGNAKPFIVSEHNFNSSQQLVKMFETLELEITDFTPSGKPSAGKATMSKHKKHPFVKVLQTYKDYNKLYNGFISQEGQVFKNLQYDGKVRPNFMNTGTKTGRLSCSSPNLQQLPNTKEGFAVRPRDVFCAPEGYKMFSCDYSGQEVYTMAHLSKDEDLIKMLLRGQDQHLVNANAVFKLGIPEEKLEASHPEHEQIKKDYGLYRKKGKIFSFGVPYGMGSHKCSRDFNVSEEEAEEMMNNLKGKFPKLFEAIDQTHQECNENFMVRSLAGRIRHFGTDFEKVRLKNKNLENYTPEIITLMKQGAAHRQSFNFKIQGLCADMIRAAMVNVYIRNNKPEWDLKAIMQVHDEAVYIVKEEYVDEATTMVKKAFEDVTKKFIVPLKADIEIGENYGNAK